MDPFSLFLITIGSKAIGAGKVVTAVKVAIATKKLSAIAVAAKNTLIQHSLIDMLPTYDPDLMDVDMADSYSQPSSSDTPSTSAEDSEFLNYLQDRFENGSLYDENSGRYAFDRYGQLKDIPLEQIVDDDMLNKIKEVYGEDAYLSSVSAQMGESAKGLILPTDFDEWDQMHRSVYLSDTILNPFDPIWEEINAYISSEDDLVNHYMNNNEWLPSGNDPSLSPDAVVHSNDMMGENLDLAATNNNLSIDEILEKTELSDMEQDQMIGKQMASKFEVLSNDPSFQANADPLRREIGDKLNRYFEQNTIHFKGNDKLLQLVSHHSKWKELPGDLADIAKDVLEETEEEKMSMGSIAYLMGIFLGVELYQENSKLQKLIKEQSREVEFLKKKVEDYYAQKQAEDPEKEESSEKISIPRGDLLKYLSDGDTRALVELLLEYLPSDSPERDEVVLISGRLNKLKEKELYFDLFPNAEITQEWIEINRDLMAIINRLYS